MKKIKFQLEELTCPSCVKNIESVLKKTNGVEEVNVLFNSSKVNIQFDEMTTNSEELQKKIEKLGYEVL